MDLQTGDILLFRGTRWYSGIIKCVQGSEYSHVGFVLKDPIWIHPHLKGLYYLQSGSEGTPDMQTGQPNQFGVQIQPIARAWDDGKSQVYVRRVYCERGAEFDKKLSDIYKNILGKPYTASIMDWLNAIFYVRTGRNFDVSLPDGNYDKEYWCSALLGCVFVNLGLLAPSTQWSLLGPTSFSSEEEITRLDWKCALGEDTLLTRIHEFDASEI